MPKVFLGSASTARKAILQNSILRPEDELILCPSDVAEAAEACEYGGVTDLVLENTKRKTQGCLAILGRQHLDYAPGDILICGDCVVVNKRGDVYNKPTSEQEALKFLEQYDLEKYFSVVQAISVTRLSDVKTFIDTEVCSCSIAGIPSIGRKEYLEKSGAMYAAGALIVEDQFIRPHVISLEGGDLNSIMGLSVDLAKRLINQSRAF